MKLFYKESGGGGGGGEGGGGYSKSIFLLTKNPRNLREGGGVVE